MVALTAAPSLRVSSELELHVAYAARHSHRERLFDSGALTFQFLGWHFGFVAGITIPYALSVRCFSRRA